MRTPFRNRLLFACAGLALWQAGSSTQVAPTRPNVVMFIMDDLGYGDIGSYGVPDAQTPHIDRLAREGVKLTDFYANHANCSPTRTGFITGRYQQRYGIESPLRVVDEPRHLPPSETSLPRLMKNAGYATGLIGKWHLGAHADSGPNRHGFDEFWGFRQGAVDYYSHTVVTTTARQNPVPVHDLYHNEEPTTSSGYLTDEITAHAEAFIQQRATSPFFLEVAYNATHWPFQRPDLAAGQRGWTDYLESGTRADYVAILERADQGIGRILGVLDRLKLAPNTLVMFTSDNGGEWLSRNAPLFHRKSTVWEGGIRVPLLLRWPGHLKPGTTSSQVGITMDLTASILAAAGVTPPPGYRPEGIDLVGVLQKGAIVDRTLFWRMPVIPPAPVSQRAVRRGYWKFVDDRGQDFLFDLRTDPGERHDVAQSHIALMQELRGLVDKWEADVNAEAKQRAAPTSSADVTITTPIHSSIQLEHAGKVIQIDPWSAGDLSRLKPADLILITDDPAHHLDVKAIQKLRKPGAPVIIPANGKKHVPDGVVLANGDSRDIAGFRVEATAAYDVTPGVSFHPKGEANGYIVTIGGPPSPGANREPSYGAASKRIYIVGVTECVPEIRAAKDIDIAFFPMNLPADRMEPNAAIECIKAFKPKVVYPYHYDQAWATAVGRGDPRPAPTTRGLQEMKTALEAAGIEVRLAAWYPND